MNTLSKGRLRPAPKSPPRGDVGRVSGRSGAPSPHMTVHDVAGFLAVAPKTVYARWAEWGLNPVRIGGRTTGALRFRRSDVEGLAESWLDT